MSDVDAKLRALEQRLDDAHRTRASAGLALAGFIALFTALAILRRSTLFGRAALLAAPVALAGVLALSALGVSTPWQAIVGVAVLCATAAPLLAAATSARTAAACSSFPQASSFSGSACAAYR